MSAYTSTIFKSTSLKPILRDKRWVIKITGVILKGIGGFYYVMDENKRINVCKARGRFRKERTTPLPGDRVTFLYETEKTYGFIEEIHDRKNELTRPAVANVTMCVIVLSPKKPMPDFMLVDKLLVQCLNRGIKAVILINKIDIAERKEIDAIRAEYSETFRVLTISAKEKTGMQWLKRLLRGECACFSGQSAVGKSSIINALFPQLRLDTGVLSKKVQRGRHTTRHTELLVMTDIDGTVVDTPGFSVFDALDIPPETLKDYYPEFAPYTGECRFLSCLHDREPGCGVKHAVKTGKVVEGRYRRYLEILQELKEKRAKKYD